MKRHQAEAQAANDRCTDAIRKLSQAESELAGVSNSIRVTRIPAVAKTTTVFEADPNVVERNRQLAEELEAALVD